MGMDAVDLYDYELPPERIAQEPVADRVASRLMILGGTEPPLHRTFAELPRFLRAGDLLVRNVTRVIPARLCGQRRGGGRAELLLVRELEPLVWECLGRPAARLKPGREISFPGHPLAGVVAERQGGGRLRVRFSGVAAADFMAALEAVGEVPLPPYIQRQCGPSPEDRERYQTTYASVSGAVAAPTAGLHFTPPLFAALAAGGVEVADLVLHVGPGTFRPVQAERLGEHRMDVEHYVIPEETAAAVERARREGRRVIAVGTTSTRALEAAASRDGGVQVGPGATDIFIHPPYRFRAIDGLITNFHLPRSTLLMLVSALTGRERLLAAYAEAVRQGYRFYSYGDAMLVVPGGL